MSAYVILDTDVHDPALYDDYKKISAATVAQYGGTFEVRGGPAENLEGDWEPKRVVVLRFESVDAAKTWWNSPEYAPAKAMRQRASNGKMIVVEGA